MRYEDWPEQLNEYLSSDHKFDWVENNCAFFTASAVLVMTGKDPVKKYRKLKTKNGLLKRLKKIGGYKGLWNEFEQIPVLTAQRGDIILIPVFVDNENKLDAVGICIGSDVVLLTENGITRYPLTEASFAWRVK